jgi:hypothetical protein
MAQHCAIERYFGGTPVGMHDELYCEAELLPDSDVPAGAIFETKAFPHPFLMRYSITKAGRLIDGCGWDLECDGYLEFYHYLDQPVGNSNLAQYRAHFCRGQLDNIVRVNEEPEGGMDGQAHLRLSRISHFRSRSSIKRHGRYGRGRGEKGNEE